MLFLKNLFPQKKAEDQPPKIYFNHIPKAMETSLYGVLDLAYPATNIFSTAYATSAHFSELKKAAQWWSKYKLNNLRLVAGHIPHYAFADTGLLGFTKIVGIRHPFKRFESGFSHMCRGFKVLQPRAQNVTTQIQEKLSRGDFSSVCTLLEPWYPFTCPNHYLLQQKLKKTEDLAKAMTTLREYEIVYTEANFDHVQRMVATWLGLPLPVEIPKANVRPDWQQKESIVPPEFEESFRKTFPYEYDLYEAAMEMAPKTADFLAEKAVHPHSYTAPVSGLGDAFPAYGLASRQFRANGQSGWRRHLYMKEAVMELPSPPAGKVTTPRFSMVLSTAPAHIKETLSITIQGMPLKQWCEEHRAEEQFEDQMFWRISADLPATGEPLPITIQQTSNESSVIWLEDIRWK